MIVAAQRCCLPSIIAVQHHIFQQKWIARDIQACVGGFLCTLSICICALTEGIIVVYSCDERDLSEKLLLHEKKSVDRKRDS